MTNSLLDQQVAVVVSLKQISRQSEKHVLCLNFHVESIEIRL